MSQKQDLLTPVGRMVQGSLYEPKTTDAEGNPLVYKHGTQQGQPRVEYFLALAIAKGPERHWSETEWGKKIWAVGHAGFPSGQASSPAFAWKITDGDSTIPNRNGRKPCDREGYPGHWVLNFAGSFAPKIFNENGSQQLLEEGHVNLGDYIQVYGSVNDNASTQQPGIYLNHSLVAFAGYGKRIFLGVDPKSVGFGGSPLPPGASPTPLPSDFNPAPTGAPPAHVANPPAYNPPPTHVTPPPVANPPVTPHHGILTPPVPAPVAKVLTGKAPAGVTYEMMVANGWNDAMLIQHGYLVG